MALKKIVLVEDDANHARLRLKFRYDNISQNRFFKMMIESYLEDDKDFMNFFQKKKEFEKHVMRNKDIEDKKETEKQFALNKEEIENIFDIIAKEDSDL